MPIPALDDSVYVSLDDLKLALKIPEADTTRDILLDYARAAASRSIDAYTGRRFYADASATARTLRVRGRVVHDQDGELLLVDDISSTTGLVVEFGSAGSSSYTTVAAAGYEAWPDNAIVRGLPIQGIRRVTGAWGFGNSNARAQITARWGWPATPDVVVQATLLQAIRLYSRKDSPQGVLGSEEWGAIRVSRMDPDVKSLVRHLVIPSFG